MKVELNLRFDSAALEHPFDRASIIMIDAAPCCLIRRWYDARRSVWVDVPSEQLQIREDNDGTAVTTTVTPVSSRVPRRHSGTSGRELATGRLRRCVKVARYVCASAEEKFYERGKNGRFLADRVEWAIIRGTIVCFDLIRSGIRES